MICKYFLPFSLLSFTFFIMSSMVSDEKSGAQLTEDRFYMMGHFSLAAFKSLSLPLSFNGLIIMCISVSVLSNKN